jgi:hypothetical protein
MISLAILRYTKNKIACYLDHASLIFSFSGF